MLVCPECGYSLHLKVDVANMFAEYTSKMSDNEVHIKISKLRIGDVEIVPVEFYCPYCHQAYNLDEVKTRCTFSGILGLVSEFVMIAFKGKDGRLFGKKVVHETKIDEYVESVNKYIDDKFERIQEKIVVVIDN